MRVLMFGWEFPPHIAGGLGTACYGMTKGLAYNDVDVLFVMPSASGDEDESAVKIINASDVAVDVVNATVDEFLGKVQFVHIGTNMIPYVDKMIEALDRNAKFDKYSNITGDGVAVRRVHVARAINRADIRIGLFDLI